MNCKACNTRIIGNETKCPNCGRASGKQAKSSSADDSRDGSLSQSLSNASADIELDEIAEDEPKNSGGKGKASGARKRAPKLALTPRPAEMRALVAEKPALIERGLGVYKERGKAVGEGFETDVGDIDLLARDEAGGLVLVMVAEPEAAKELIPELLPRLGWVRKHVAKTGQEVRAIVLTETMPDELEYAAAAVGDMLSFKTYRVALTFEDVEL